MSRFFTLLERYPPVLVRLLARRNRQTITTERIASDMGVTPMYALQISSRHDWRGLSIDNFMGFTCACNLDLTNTGDVNRVETYLRKNQGRPMFKYLTRDPEWKTYYLPLLVNWRKSLDTIPKALPEPIQRLLAGIKL
jgi:hypothetical protein